MQFSTAILALASAMAVTADTTFQVSDFTAACLPHSSQCSYSFNLMQPNSMDKAPGVQCSKMATSDGTLPAVTDGTCIDSSRTWTVTKTDAGLVLEASQQVSRSSFNTGKYTIPSSDLHITKTGASSQQTYTGPSSFTLV